MGDETMGREAGRLMGKYRDHIEKQGGKSRDITYQRWLKKNPGKNREDFNMCDVSGDSSMLNTS